MNREKKIFQLLILARSLIGKPYKYGARPEDAPEAFDCSSFTQYLFRQLGVKLPRSTILQAETGNEVKLENIQLGDLIFFHGTQGFYNPKFPAGIGHVILYAGGDKTIHAASRRIQDYPNVIEGGRVEERDLAYVQGKYAPLIVIKRIL